MSSHLKKSMRVLTAVLLVCGISAACADIPLIEAAKKNDLAAVKTLIKQKADVNGTEIDGATALLWATYGSDAEIVKALIAARADVNRGNRYGLTPLLQASRIGNAAMVEALLKAGADPQAAIRKGETPLMAAAGSGNAAVVKMLIDRGVDVNAEEPEQHQTALMWAVGEGHLDVVKMLLVAGANPNQTAKSNELRDDLLREGGRQMVNWTRGGLTSLMIAARDGHIEVAQALVDAGAKLDSKNPDNLTAMLIAVLNDRTDLAAMLLERGADPNDGSLYEAIQVQNLRIGATASDASRPRPDHRNELSPLDLIGRLLDKGADPNRVAGYIVHSDGFGVPQPITLTPYARALQVQDVATLKLMLDKKLVDPNVVTADSPTPLMQVSVGAGRGGLFTGNGDGGFRHMSERGSIPAAELLVAAGAEVNGRTTTGETPMHRAAQNGEVKMIRYLADHGAVVDVKSAAGFTPLDYAMGKLPPAPRVPGAGGLGGGPPAPKPEAVALLRQLMGLPADKEVTAVLGAAGRVE